MEAADEIVIKITPEMVSAAMDVLSDHCSPDGYFTSIGASAAVERAIHAAIKLAR